MPTINQSSPDLLQSVLSASQNAVMVYQAIPNPGGLGSGLKLTMLNAVAERNLGRPATDVLGLTFGRLYPHLVGTGLDERYLEVIRTNQATRFEFQYDRPGQERPAWCDVSAVPLGENSVVVSYNDISQHKADADAARLAHVLQQTFDASFSGITVLEAIHNEQGQLADFKFVMINEAGLRMSGYTREQLLGRTLWEIYPATGINGLFEEYVQVYETGQPIAREHYYPEYNTWRDIKVVRVPQGIMLTYNDISKLKKSEEAAHSQTHLLTDLIQNVPVGLALMQAVRSRLGNTSRIVDFKITRINTRFEQTLNPAARQVTGQLLTTVFPVALASGLLSRCILSVEERQPLEFELPVLVKSELNWFKITVAPTGNQVMLTMTDISQIKRTQLEYHQQAELLSSVLDGAQNAIIALKAIRQADQIVDFAFVLQNGVAQQLLGLAEDELTNHSLQERLSGLNELGQIDTYRQVVATGKSVQSEIEFNFGKGLGWYAISAVKREDGIVLTIQDKTSQKRAEQQIKAQAQLLASISDNTPAGLVLWEAVRDESPQRAIVDFRYRMSNLMNTYVTGYTADSLVGQDLLSLFPRFRGSQLEATLRETLETGRVQRMIFTDYTESPEGWFDAQFIRVSTIQPADGSVDTRLVDTVLMTYMDVTEQHKAQLAQKQQADLMQLVINAQPAGIVLFEPLQEPTTSDQPGKIIDFTYRLVNETQRRLTGRSDRDLIGQRLRVLFPSDQGRELFERMVEVIQTGQPKVWLMPFFSDGIRGWFQSSLLPHGNQVLFTFLDVTDLKRQQQALEYINHELRRSNENLQKFAYIASHDLQEPLRKIQSFGDILTKQYKPVLDQPAQEIIGRMQGAAQRMSRLIKHLLAYSRLNTQQLQRKPIRLAELLNLILDDLSLQIEESNASVEWGDLPIIHGDEGQLQQLFQNLLSNALKYHLPNTSPRVQVSYRKLLADQLPVAIIDTVVATSDTGSQSVFYEIRVSDNGIGFDEKYLDRIFQVFQRLHSKDIYPGTGIGLAICQKVVENHRGALTAISQPDKGATFLVYLPVYEP